MHAHDSHYSLLLLLHQLIFTHTTAAPMPSAPSGAVKFLQELAVYYNEECQDDDDADDVCMV